MVFESQVKRQQYIRFGLQIVVDIAVAVIATAILGQTAVMGALIFVGLQALGLVYMMVRILVEWLYYAMMGKQLGIRHYRSLLQSAAIPAAREVESSWQGYLGAIVDDAAIPEATRIGAAALAGYLTALTQTSGFWGAVRINSMVEAAIAAHSEVSRSRPVEALPAA